MSRSMSAVVLGPPRPPKVEGTDIDIELDIDFDGASVSVDMPPGAHYHMLPVAREPGPPTAPHEPS